MITIYVLNFLHCLFNVSYNQFLQSFDADPALSFNMFRHQLKTILCGILTMYSAHERSFDNVLYKFTCYLGTYLLTYWLVVWLLVKSVTETHSVFID